MEEAVKRASEMERERAYWSQLPLIQELYKVGWRGWQDLPGAQLIQDLYEWEQGINRQNKNEPSYPKVHSNPYIWKGELAPEQMRDVDIRLYLLVANGIGSTGFSTVQAFLEGNLEARQLINWWHFDEETHEDMKLYAISHRWGVPEDHLLMESEKLRIGLLKEQEQAIDINNIRTVTRFQATRYGPAILAGALMLFERENVWTSQRLRPALQRHYRYTNEDLVFVNVHTFIDIFHVKLGEYLVAKYAKTKEEQELVRAMYQNQKLRQAELSKAFFNKLFAGKTVKLTQDEVDGNVG